MNRVITREMRRQLERDNAKQPEHLVEIPVSRWPDMSFMTIIPFSVWRSRKYLVQGFHEGNGIVRLSIGRTTMLPNGRWDDGLLWDELQEIKRQVGYGDKQAVEIFPEERNVVNVANMRHLWVLPGRLSFGWVRP